MKLKEQRMNEIEAQYPDHWVLIQVTKRDRYGRTSHGIVLGHGDDSDKDALIGEGVSFHKAHPETPTFLFWTGRLIREGVGVIL